VDERHDCDRIPGSHTGSPVRHRGQASERQKRLNALDGIEITNDRIDRYPSFSASIIANEATRQRFLEIIEWLFEEAGRRPNEYVQS